MSTVPLTMLHQLEAQAARLQDAPALWTKRHRQWFSTSWREYAQRVKWAALALAHLGVTRGNAVCILGFNREEWLISDLGVMATGAVPVGIYTTSSAEQIEYIVGHCEAPIVIVENAAYLERVLSVKSKLPKLKHLVVMDAPAELPKGVMSYSSFLALGQAQNQSRYWELIEALKPEDLGALIYTSGTTGNPKGVMLSHRNICWTTVQLSKCAEIREGDVLISYLPLSHIAEQICSIYGPLLHAIQVYFAESFDSLRDTIREVRPTVFFGVPRVWEKFKTGAEKAMAQQSGARGRLLSWARKVSTKYHQHVERGSQMSVVLEAEYRLAQRLVFSKLKARIGFERCHLFATSAAPIARDVLDFFQSIDIVLHEVYGLSEVTGPMTANSQSAHRLGTLGRPMPGVDVRIAPDGEILARGDNVCVGYFKEKAATEDLIQDGWLHSGDVGEFDDDGFLKITGRKKEIIVTSGGKKTAPTNIEALLKTIAPIGHAMVIGDNRNYLTALLTIDPEKIEAFAKEHQWPPTPQALSVHGPFREWLTAKIESEVNAKVARFEHVRKFDVLPSDFTVETGELTSTLKLRRGFTGKKFGSEIERLYA